MHRRVGLCVLSSSSSSQGEATLDDAMGPWLHPVIQIGTTGGSAEWVTFEVYQLINAF